VGDEADVGFVDAHAERNRGDNHHALLAQKPFLVPAARVGARAGRGAAAKAPIALGGGAAGAGSNGTQALTAVAALNRVLGAAGGTVRPNLAHATAYSGLRDIEDFAAQAASGDVPMVILAGVDPVHDLPESLGIRKALERADFVVSLDSFLNDSASLADWVLATDNFLETWGDDISSPGAGMLTATLQQPVQKRLHDTLSVTDIILKLATRLGGAAAEALPHEDAQAFTRSEWEAAWESMGVSGDFNARFRRAQQDGVWAAALAEGMADELSPEAAAPQPPPAAEFAGGEAEYPFVFHPYATQGFREGVGANLPWMQELPDPLTSVAYGSWAEVNPATARELGLRTGDLVELESPAGKVSVPVVEYPGVRPDVVAMPLGHGHRANGRYARGRGANAASLLAAQSDSATGTLAWAATRVALRALGKRGRLIRTSGVSRTLGRQILGPDGEH